jgi:transposase
VRLDAAVGTELLDPLYARLKQFVLSSKVVGTDDTPVKVLDRSLVRTTRKGRFWPYLGDRNHGAAVFDYTPIRERAGPERFLKGYRGYLQADAYVAYDSFFTNPARGMVEVACWAHKRRHFHQALDTDPARMGAVLAYIAQLYAVEKRARRSGVEGEELRLLREQASQPVLTQLHEYLLKIRDRVLPKSEAGLAVSYALKNWAALTRYCEDGDLFHFKGSGIRLYVRLHVQDLNPIFPGPHKQILWNNPRDRGRTAKGGDQTRTLPDDRAGRVGVPALNRQSR